MASMFFSVATLFTLLAGDGLATNAATGSVGTQIRPAVDVPSPGFWDSEDRVVRGGQAARIEFEAAEPHDGMSAWYRLAYVDGGTRLQVFEHSASATVGPESDMMRIEAIAWRLANEVVEPENRSTESDHLPLWARVRTGSTDGPSAGLMTALAYIDLLTPGALVGDLRVAGTGGIRPDGLAFRVKGIDVKVATAMLTRPDVIFVTRSPKSVENVTIVQSYKERIPAQGYTVGEWLNVEGYEQAGRDAAGHPGTAPVVLVHDLRQALAWLCGRTDGVIVCAIALRSLGIPIGDTPQVLVDRGLVTRQALDQAPVEMIFGPAHPLGARDVGIPCSELVYTRC